MDPRAFKASRSRRVNDIEFRINVCPSPRQPLPATGVLARGMAGGSKCSAGLAFQALRLFEVLCLLRRNSASLLKNRAAEHTGYGSAIAKLRSRPVPDSKILLGAGKRRGKKDGAKPIDRMESMT